MDFSTRSHFPRRSLLKRTPPWGGSTSKLRIILTGNVASFLFLYIIRVFMIDFWAEINKVKQRKEREK